MIFFLVVMYDCIPRTFTYFYQHVGYSLTNIARNVTYYTQINDTRYTSFVIKSWRHRNDLLLKKDVMIEKFDF